MMGCGDFGGWWRRCALWSGADRGCVWRLEMCVRVRHGLMRPVNGMIDETGMHLKQSLRTIITRLPATPGKHVQASRGWARLAREAERVPRSHHDVSLSHILLLMRPPPLNRYVSRCTTFH